MRIDEILRYQNDLYVRFTVNHRISVANPKFSWNQLIQLTQCKKLLENAIKLKIFP